MEEFPNEFCLFKILPCYKYQNERDKFIRFSQDVLIASALENINRDAFLCLNSKLPSPQKSSCLAEKTVEEQEDTEFAEEEVLNEDFMIAFDKSSRFL